MNLKNIYSTRMFQCQIVSLFLGNYMLCTRSYEYNSRVFLKLTTMFIFGIVDLLVVSVITKFYSDMISITLG